MNSIKVWNDKQIRIRPSDRYTCLTDMAQAASKKVNDWVRLQSTTEFIQAAVSVTGIPATELVVVKQGGIPEEQGTWGHPKVAIQFAQWCNPLFALQVSTWIDELLTTGSVDINLEKVKPLTVAQLILAQAQVLVDLEESVSKVSQKQLEQNYRLEAIEQRSLNAMDSLKLIPAATVEPEQMTTKANLSRLVRGYIAANNLDYRTTWNALYREHRDRTHIDLKVRGKNHKPQLSAPEYAEKFGYLEQLYAVAYEMFVPK